MLGGCGWRSGGGFTVQHELDVMEDVSVELERVGVVE